MSKILLQKAHISDSEQIHKMQVEAFLPYYEKYNDNEISPVLETIERIAKRFENPCIT